MIKINSQEIKNNRFPNGELKIDCINLKEKTCNIEFYWHSDEDLVELFFIVKYLKEKYNNIWYELEIKYMPYSRMDRKKDDSVFTLKYVTDFINALKIDSIKISEPHSDVCLALLNAEGVYPTIKILDKVIKIINFDINKDKIFYPDAGAQKRYADLKFPHIVGYKHRDWKTGKIMSLEIYGNIPQSNFNVIIIDDLCSFGGTFLYSAKKLKEVGASDIHLIVGHCEDSILNGEMIKSGLINKIYTTNSIFTKSHEIINIMEV